MWKRRYRPIPWLWKIGYWSIPCFHQRYWEMYWYMDISVLFVNITRKYPLRGYILGVLANTSTWDRILWLYNINFGWPSGGRRQHLRFTSTAPGSSLRRHCSNFLIFDWNIHPLVRQVRNLAKPIKYIYIYFFWALY